MKSGTFKDNDISLDLSVVGSDVVCISNKKNTLAKLPLKSIKNMYEKQLKKEISEIELLALIENSGASLDVEADFDVDLSDPYNYGEDRDGNRGEMRQDYESVEDANVYLSKADLVILNEQGEVVGEAIDLTKDNDGSLVSFIANLIDADVNRYIKD